MLWTAHKIALFPARYRVGGQTLMPLTVGHFLVLEHLESPYVCGGPAMPHDLATALLVCSVPWRVAAWIIRRPRLLKLALWLVFRRMGVIDWKPESVKFGRWISDCTWMPERFKQEGEKNGFPPCSPYAYRLAYMLMDRFSEREIMAMPMPKAHLYALARAESQGAQFERLDEYRENGLPEGYAYHPKDYPEIEQALHPEEHLEQEQVTQ